MTVVYSDPKKETSPLTEKAIAVTVKSVPESVISGISPTAALLDIPNFQPGTTLLIEQQGISAIRLPLPSSELVTQVFHEDGSMAYTSTRAKKSSGSAVLSHSKLGDLISTTYTWGPGRPPVLKYIEGQDGSDTVTADTKCCARTTTFTLPDGRVFNWGYASTKDGNGKRVNIILLREKETGKILAQLSRGDGTRSEGTSKWAAGNGGRLILDQEATSHLDEALIVATCLMMLKKEIDRRRGMQWTAIISAVAVAC